MYVAATTIGVSSPSCGFHLACSWGAAPAGGPDPELRHGSVQYERHRKRRVPEQRVLRVSRVGHYELSRNVDQAYRCDSQRYGERSAHPLPVKRYPSCADVDEAFDEGNEEQGAEEADDHPLPPAGEGDHQAHEQGRHPDHHPDGDEEPPDSAVVGEVPRADPSDELEGGQRQVEPAQDHVHRHDGRVLQEAGVVGLLEVVCDRCPDADERQESDNYTQRPQHGLSRHPILLPGAFPQYPDNSVTMRSRLDTASVLPIPAAGGWGCRPGPTAAPRCPTGSGRAHRKSAPHAP